MSLGNLYIHNIKRITTETRYDPDTSWTYLHFYHENDVGEETCFTIAAFHKKDIPSIPIEIEEPQLMEEPNVRTPRPAAEGYDCPFL